jgi:hypothetical protein
VISNKNFYNFAGHKNDSFCKENPKIAATLTTSKQQP